MPIFQCTRCKRTNPPPKRCAACKKAWYCGAECQKRDWVCHIFDCNPTREINTADYLALAVERDLIPEHRQTCEDYGFFRPIQQNRDLLGVYVSLLHPNYMAVKPQVVHKWRKQGALAENIKKEFEKSPDRMKSPDYLWFLRHEDVFRSDPQVEERSFIRSGANDLVRRAWVFTGGSPTLSTEEMQRQVSALPPHKFQCHKFFAELLSGSHPSPEDDVLWVEFGFCTARDREDERNIARAYKWLMYQTTLDEFSDAYRSKTMIELFKKKGFNDLNPCIVDLADPCLVDILSNPGIRTVWYLRQYIETKIIHGRQNQKIKPSPIVAADFGFTNCLDARDHDLLFDLYKEFFALGSRANPIELCEAAQEERLFCVFYGGSLNAD
ncbi:hypothetical protein NP233_g6143 [Leucocoprinus birnbaumii]|uniref:MYND-type domain-containing protein n=1 Tax=Leucocoprinus birnbaumii TaxID=56174 RepID=A0AAD5VRJ4_9AGAR|nr:hypothetical protein NP233_g6143 [Leucocoprinus birnbaumii]